MAGGEGLEGYGEGNNLGGGRGGGGEEEGRAYGLRKGWPGEMYMSPQRCNEDILAQLMQTFYTLRLTHPARMPK